MDQFFPFIHEKKKKDEPEQLPLYIELIPPEPKKIIDEPEEEQRVVIIELF